MNGLEVEPAYVLRDEIEVCELIHPLYIRLDNNMNTYVDYVQRQSPN